MDLGLGGKKVLITGGSKGIGLSCGRVFLREGCSIILVARSAEALAQAQAELGGQGRVQIVAADLSKGEERARVHALHPDVDILVNNAGAIPAGGLLEMTMERWEEAWALKVLGYIHLTKLYLATMKARGDGVIVNIIGGAGRNPRYDYICGGAGNAALMAFTSAVGGRSVDWGVRCFGINPAQTRTERTTTQSKTRAREKFGDETRWQEMLANLPLGRLIEPEEIANTAAFLASSACGYVSGTVLDVDGGGGFR
ncbi:MAG: short-chain dehydrogenase/reductase [Acetobacteraceae bacterium]|nr:short-chain dehydrogenase/reductase [Acetobacteraceae bacterium]